MHRLLVAAELIGGLFDNLGPPTRASSLAFQETQRLVTAQPLSNSFCLTVELAPAPAIVSGWNTDSILGISPPDFPTYLDLIHPHWWMTYLLYGKALYALTSKVLTAYDDKDLSYQIKVPLRVSPDRYVWFNQVALAGEVDQEGRLLSHLNMYQWDREFDETSLLSSPILSAGSKQQFDVGKQLQKNAEVLFFDTYFSSLKPRALQVLSLYRALERRLPNASINSQLVAEESHKVDPQNSISKATVEKRNQDILACLRDESLATHSPMNTIKEVKQLAQFLNTAFGH